MPPTIHKPITRILPAVLVLLAAASCAQTGVAPQRMVIGEGPQAASPGRTFAIRYVAKVTEIPTGTRKLRLWWPVPQGSTLQEISDLQFSGPTEPRLATEKIHGNLMAYTEMDNPPPAVEFSTTYTVKRREVKTAFDGLADEGADPPAMGCPFLGPERLVVVDEEIRSLAAGAAKDRRTTVEKARALYDLVRKRMTYDKTGTGWGRGDSHFACTVGKGNCTDFHALFTALCRAEGIASGFEIGLYLPYEAAPTGQWSQPQTGYHCWAAFRVPGRAWVPVDISEANRNPDRGEFFFGGWTANRVALSQGRDLVLDPPQDGEPLNFFIDPYAEVDGKAHPKASRSWFYRDLE